EYRIVTARIDDQIAVDCKIPILVATSALGYLALVIPDEVTGPCIHSLYVIAGIWKVHHSVIHEWRGFLRPAVGHAPRPNHTQLRNVVTIDLVQGAVAPVIERL